MLLLGLLEPQYEGTAHIETSITINQTPRRNIPEDFIFSAAVFLVVCGCECDTSCTDTVSGAPS